jgi:hypothetical protein
VNKGKKKKKKLEKDNGFSLKISRKAILTRMRKGTKANRFFLRSRIHFRNEKEKQKKARH